MVLGCSGPVDKSTGAAPAVELPLNRDQKESRGLDRNSACSYTYRLVSRANEATGRNFSVETLSFFLVSI